MFVLDSDVTEVDKSRKKFEENNKVGKNLDELLALSLEQEDKLDREQKEKIIQNNKELNNAIQESELNKIEEDLINSAIKLSLMESSKKPQKEGGLGNEVDYLSIPAIQTALEFGFSLDDAILAYTMYSNSPDLMLQYLYSMKDSQNNYI
mgnify:CR=1 FL=1